MTLPPGFVVSSFATIWHRSPSVTRRSRTSGVLPTRSRSESAISGSSGSSSMDNWTLHALEVTVAGEHRIALLPVMRRRQAATRLKGSGPTIFAEMSALAAATGRGQPRPGVSRHRRTRRSSREAAIDAIRAGHNQYPPGIGIAELRQAIADHQRRFYGIELDPDTRGARHCGRDRGARRDVPRAVRSRRRGDHVRAVVRRVRRRCSARRRRPPNRDAATAGLRIRRRRAACRRRRRRTRFVLLNSPHNPTGKVFTRDELDAIAAVCVEHDLLAVTDEVYEHLVFEGDTYRSCTLPGMADRTLTISSAGKTFSFTGWKIGWVTGPADLVAVRPSGEAVADLRQRRAVPARGGARTRPRRRRATPRWPTTSATSATTCARDSSTPGSRSSFPQGRTS